MSVSQIHDIQEEGDNSAVDISRSAQTKLPKLISNTQGERKNMTVWSELSL